MIRDLHTRARQVVIDFLQSDPATETPFWSVREISKRYSVSEYTAYSILKTLTDNGYLEQAPQKRAFLKKDVNLSLLGTSIGTLRLAVIWPYWKSEEPGNFALELSREITRICKQSGYPYIFLDNPHAWGDPSLSLRLKAISANAVLPVSPPSSALILLTKLRSEKISTLVLGIPREGYDELDISTIDADGREPLRLLLLKLKARGVKHPLMVGVGDLAFMYEERVGGLTAAFPELPQVDTAGFFSNGGEPYSHIRKIKDSLMTEDHPDALIFNDTASLDLALQLIPNFAEGARQGRYHVAVFDDTGIRYRLQNEFPLIALTMSARELAKESLDMLQNLRNGLRIPKKFRIPRDIYWPEGF